MDRGAWWAAVHGIADQAQLSPQACMPTVAEGTGEPAFLLCLTGRVSMTCYTMAVRGRGGNFN